ncbi:MAG: hypothetical protein AAF632_27025 [Bacteroidota bacterium]
MRTISFSQSCNSSTPPLIFFVRLATRFCGVFSSTGFGLAFLSSRFSRWFNQSATQSGGMVSVKASALRACSSSNPMACLHGNLRLGHVHL